MDQRIQSLARELRGDPADAELARRYRATLARVAAADPGLGQRLRDELEGVLAAPLAGQELHGKRELPAWRRLSAGDAGWLLAPALPRAERLAERWRAPGVALWISSGLVLLEAPDHALEARCPESGALVWSVPSAREEAGEHDEDEERACVLSWAVAPWGAVEVWAHYEAAFEYRRRGRYDAELGRVTTREVVGRRPTRIQLGAQVLAPPGESWSGVPATPRWEPDRTVERASPGQGLAGGDLCPEDWNDLLHLLALDPSSRHFGVRWRDARQDWSVLHLSGGGPLPLALGPAGWTVEGEDEDPFPEPGAARAGSAAPGSCAAPGGLVANRAGQLEQRAPDGRLLRALPLPPELAHDLPLAVDGGILLVGREGPGAGARPLLHLASWERGAIRDVHDVRPWAPDSPLAACLEGRTLLPWSQEGNPERTAQLLVANERVILQLGVDEVVVLAARPEDASCPEDESGAGAGPGAGGGHGARPLPGSQGP